MSKNLTLNPFFPFSHFWQSCQLLHLKETGQFHDAHLLLQDVRASKIKKFSNYFN